MFDYTKFISLGCSYSLQIGENFSYPASSIDFLLDLVKFLKSKEIYNKKHWIIDITQVGRLNRKIPKEVESNVDSFISIGDDYYCFFIENIKYLKTEPNFPLDWWESEFKNHHSKTFENHIQDYLNRIKEIQDELVGIEYTMYLMNNTFEGYFYEGGLLRHRYSDNTKYKVPNLKGTIHVKQLFPYEWNQIDLSKFKFYKTDENSFGGLDEYTIDNFDFSDFMDTKIHSNNLNPLGMHPNMKVRLSFFENVLMEK